MNDYDFQSVVEGHQIAGDSGNLHNAFSYHSYVYATFGRGPHIRLILACG